MMVIRERLLGAATLCAAAVALAADSQLVERVDVSLVQVQVSVLDAKAGSRASVRGLAAPDFDVRVDGTRVPADALVIDEICGGADALRPMLFVIDFNYVDTQGRLRVADAIEKASALPVPGLAFKFYGITREVRALADGGLTRDGAVVRDVADLVRSTAFVGDHVRPTVAPGSGPPPDSRPPRGTSITPMRNLYGSEPQAGASFRVLLAANPPPTLPKNQWTQTYVVDRRGGGCSG